MLKFIMDNSLTISAIFLAVYILFIVLSDLHKKRLIEKYDKEHQELNEYEN